MRIVTYSRVSMKKGQDPKNQVLPLRNLAKALDGEIVKEYIEHASGGNNERKEFLEALSAGDRHEYDLLLIWSLDRFSREGISNTLGYLERLKRNGIAIKSLQEPWLDTRDKGIGELLFAIFSWVAAQERKRISERVKAGLQKAKTQGKRLGRPKGSKDIQKRSVSGYRLRYAGSSKKERKLGPRKK